MFFNRRQFLVRQLPGMILVTDVPYKISAADPISLLSAEKVQVGGKEMFRIIVTNDPTNSVWELQCSSDMQSWQTVSNVVPLPTGKILWQTPPTNHAMFLRAKVVTTTIQVPGNISYQVPLLTGQTLFDAMTSLKASSKTPFDFVDESQPLGRFVTSINNTNSRRWVFTVNGQQELFGGISSYVAKNGGDVISWFIT